MTEIYEKKVADLRRRLRSLESAVVAFSGGVDSSVLVYLTHEILGDKMIAATAASHSLPQTNRRFVATFCTAHRIPHQFVKSDEFDDAAFLSNPPNRCYYCKKHLYKSLTALAGSLGFHYVVEGTNAADLSGHRPGYGASCEDERVVTPLVDAGFIKEDVRRLARELGLPTAEKPSAACLSSRVPTGTPLDGGLLCMIDQAEDVLRALGVGQVRLRHHGDIARIEVDPVDFGRCLKNRIEIDKLVRGLGWKFVVLDLIGYRTGGMNG